MIKVRVGDWLWMHFKGISMSLVCCSCHLSCKCNGGIFDESRQLESCIWANTTVNVSIKKKKLGS